ncbi:hypothetical protein FH972_025471 [Carpinus fangiana]|uniref:Uncharacterized protein n=1 Tax=Carpinus fangiana TaxID=176857 RepID=A0A5N6L137_9ROSI|nr:hypothetical protein FH972_025471 [Carpinus fangiana]
MSGHDSSPFSSERKPLDIVIVGGSLAGLMTAIVLVRSGHNVHILERNPTGLLHDQGAGVVCGPELLAFFTKYDRSKTPLAVVSPMRHYLDQEGGEIDVQYYEQKMTSWDLLYHLLRINFDGVSQEANGDTVLKENDYGKATYEYGAAVTNVERADGGYVDVIYTSSGQGTTKPTDLLIAADGPSSTIRTILAPSTRRTYAGYVAWRGTVPEADLSPSATKALVEKFTFFHSTNLQMLVYVIPGPNGKLTPGSRLVNWVWYRNYTESSPEHKDVLTDLNGHTHRTTLPVGGVQSRLWESQKEYATQRLPPQFAELVHKTQQPFVQAITDALSEKSVFYDGKVLMVGDAVAGFRPHTAASANQAALNALLLEGVAKGTLSLEEWEDIILEYARDTQKRGVQMGDRSQFGVHPLSR